MPRITAARALIVWALLSSPVVAAVAETPVAAGLAGVWSVDLRPTPDAEPYFQEMVLRLDADGGLAGTFYGSEIRDARLNLDWGAVRFAFVTKGSSGLYHTSGVLRDGRIEGSTHSLGRGFLSFWSAVRPGTEPDAESPRGSPKLNPAAPPETSQFAFLVGNRRCTQQRLQPGGGYADGGSADWNGRFILDGWAIEDEWITQRPDGTPFQGINIRSFNPETRKWDNRWLATGSLQWTYFEAEQVDDTMVMIGGEGEDNFGAYVDRNIFSNTGPDGFDWRKNRSYDGGASWIESVARIECRSLDGAP